jgi:hypothetical protein
MRCLSWHSIVSAGLAYGLFAASLVQAAGTEEKKAGETPTPRAASAPAARPALRARVDPRIELMSIIFRLAGNPEYNMPCSASPYSYDVEKYFGPFSHHPAIRKAKELRNQRGIYFDAVTSIAVHVTDASELREKIPFDQSPPRLNPRWKPAEAREFLDLVRQFVKDSDFAGFLDAHRPLYVASAIRMNEVLRRYDIRRWLDQYFGVQPDAQYGVIVGLLVGGGNYGMSVKFPDGKEEITPVIGCAHFDEHGIPVIDDAAWLPTIVHEFCHPYSNPLFEKNPELFRTAGMKLLERNRQAMQSQAYGSWQAVICETLVRASVVRYLEANHGSVVAQTELKEQRARSWKWLPGLCKKLEEYEGDRGTYPTFEQFLPEVAKYLESYADRGGD